MPYLYELAVLGDPTNQQLSELEELISEAVQRFGLRLHHEVAWEVRPAEFNPSQQRVAAAVFFGGQNAHQANLPILLQNNIPVLPVVSNPSAVSLEIPLELRDMNCLDYKAGGIQRVATALLECAGLLPRQRRVFVSYRREEARQAALQLFDRFSSRHFDVFLDTHGIAPAQDFQAMLWHRLCDSDVLVMLDTPSYFMSRWTSAEFGRAMAKGISILRIGWPGTTQSSLTTTATSYQLQFSDFINLNTFELTDSALDSICLKLEAVRSQSHAVRILNLVSNLRNAVEKIGGKVVGVGINKAVYIQLPNGHDVVVYPTVGVPTSITLHDAATNAPNSSVAIIYDSVGLDLSWLGHLDWLGKYIKKARWVKAHEASWNFADW